MTCFFCGGSAHPATGHQYTERVIACRRCFEHFFAWYRARVNHNPLCAAARGETPDLTKWKKRKR